MDMKKGKALSVHVTPSSHSLKRSTRSLVGTVLDMMGTKSDYNI